MRVIAMTYANEPVEGVLTGVRARRAYVIDTSGADTLGTRPSQAAGFPLESVSLFDQRLFESLQQAWLRKDRSGLARLWRSAIRLKPAAPSSSADLNHSRSEPLARSA